MIAPMAHKHSFVVRALWFLCIGWWLSAVTILAGSVLAATFFGLPLAFMVFNKLPQVTTLRTRTLNWTATTENGVTVFRREHHEQYNILLRAVYFYVFGLWAGLVWLGLA